MLSILKRRDPNPKPDDKVPPDVVPPTEAEPAPRENRGDPRRPASEVPSITELRIGPPRTEAVLINISEGGLLAECGTRFQPGRQVTITFMGGFSPASMSGRVARSAVAGMGPEGVRYQVGIAFAERIVLPAPPAAAPAEASAPASPAAAAEPQPASDEHRPRVNRW